MMRHDGALRRQQHERLASGGSSFARSTKDETFWLHERRQLRDSRTRVCVFLPEPVAHHPFLPNLFPSPRCEGIYNRRQEVHTAQFGCRAGRLVTSRAPSTPRPWRHDRLGYCDISCFVEPMESWARRALATHGFRRRVMGSGDHEATVDRMSPMGVEDPMCFADVTGQIPAATWA